MNELYTSCSGQRRDVSLLDILDAVLEKGVVVAGGLIISIADIDLIYLDLRLLITSIEKLTSGGNERNEPITRTDSV